MPKITLGKDEFSVDALDPERAFDLQPRILPAFADFVLLYGMFFAEAKALLDVKGDDEKGADAGASGASGVRGLLDKNVVEVVEQFLPALQRAAPVVASICAKLPPAELKAIRRELLDGATCNGQLLFSSQGNTFTVLMRGRTLDTWRLLVFALQVNFPDFFGALGASGGASG